MEAAKNRRRLIFLTSIVALCFIALGCRLVDLQWTQHDELARLAEEQHDHIYYREAPRGDIRDRRGSPLATSVPVKRVCADPASLRGHETEIARFLAPLLRTNENFLLNALSRTYLTETGGVASSRYVVLRHKLPLEDWDRIRFSLTNHFVTVIAKRKFAQKKEFALARLAWTRAIYPEDDQIRTYPNGQLAAHVLGFTGSKTVVARGRTNSVVAGAEGIEATFDEKLHGARGWVKTETTSGKQELFMFREQDVEARPGLNIVLTLDARVQQIVEEELQPLMSKHSCQSVSAIVVRPKTGEILAMATFPNFDPNAPGRDAAARRNRVITDTFEPGSTFKTVTMAGAFNDGVVRLTDMFDCENGAFRFAGYTLHDHEHYQVMSVQQIIAKSSNIGTAKVAIRMGSTRTYQYITDFGFGQRTGLPLSGEVSGYVPKLKDWKQIHISRIPIGHGVTATALQSTMAFAAVGNRGVLMRPMIVDSLVDDRSNVVAKYYPQMVRRVVSEDAAKTTVEALKTVVEKGTAEKAALEFYTVAGKTGTAQKVVDGQYSHEKYYASFIGFFPADNPELCIYISADEPLKRTGYYGGVVCGPVFKHIAERTANFLNLKPDVQPVRPNDVMASDRTPDHGAVLQVRGKL